MAVERPAPPHSIEAEEAVLGGVLVHAKKLDEVAPLLRPSDFYHPANAAIFDAMLALLRLHHPVDALTVAQQMRRSGTFERLRAFGDADYLTELMAKMVTAENIAYHAKVVRDRATARRLVEACREAAAKGYGPAADLDELVADVRRAVDQASAQVLRDASVQPIREVASSWLRDYEQKAQAADRGNPVRYVPTGVRGFDAFDGGLRPGEVMVYAGQSGRGKTALMNFTLAACGEAEVPALCFSYEMPAADILARMIGAEGGVEARRLRVPKLEASTMLRVTSACARAAEWPIWFIARPDMKVDELRQVARRWRRENQQVNALITVDYVQLVEAGLSGRNNTREQEVGHVAKQLDAMALELSCAVVMLCQLNREADKREGPPRRSDLRDSAVIFHVADIVWATHIPELDGLDKDLSKEPPGITTAYIHTLKGRNVASGTIRMMFEPPYTRFRNPDDGR